MCGIARRMGVPEDRVERFIRESPWEYEALQEHIVDSIPETVESPRGVLVIDDVGLVKQGDKSVGVHRQYSGTIGKVGNCQVAVDAVYVAPGKTRNADQVTWPLGMQLYLPEAWANDAERREWVGVPEDVEFRTKPEIALDLVDRSLKQGIEHACIVADAGYGDGKAFRAALRERGEPYVLGVTPSRLRVIPADAVIEEPKRTAGPGRPANRERYAKGTRRESPQGIAERVEQWEHVEWSQGVKGTLSGLFYRERVRVVEQHPERRYVTDEVAWLLLEKRSNELKAYVCWGVDDASLERLVELAHLRWVIEQFHRDAKQELALDDFEGRSWKGWHHHVSMVLLAHAFVSALRAETGGQEPRVPFSQVVRALVYEAGTQLLMDKHQLDRRRAKAYAADMIRGFTEWG